MSDQIFSKPQIERKLIRPRDVKNLIPGKNERTLAVERTLRRDTPPYIKIGRRIYYDLHDLEKWLDAHRVVPARKARQQNEEESLGE